MSKIRRRSLKMKSPKLALGPRVHVRLVQDKQVIYSLSLPVTVDQPIGLHRDNQHDPSFRDPSSVQPVCGLRPRVYEQQC